MEEEKSIKEEQLKETNSRREKHGVVDDSASHFMSTSLDLMKDPVTLSTGITYDREDVELIKPEKFSVFVKEIMRLEETWRVEELLRIDGALESLARSKFADLGLVELLIETLVDCEKSICEKALGILAGICNSEEGRKRANNYALTIPVLIKKFFRVSRFYNWNFQFQSYGKPLGKNEK
ncbi:hypothetical protein HAX54_026296 [Datura stramonium]|uniref:U-box domain-containing protein n=1 Tax=Datura stramonium TaxID=4076 RepID=A0ABS8V340_DATST|nr:hypothetical protein [Datura stramonium]